MHSEETSTGWFYGFKLHLVINDCGELLAVKLTSGNKDSPSRQSAGTRVNRMFGDKGYLSQALCDELEAEGITLITLFAVNEGKSIISLR
nr:transposase [Photorhabdus akhurstii]